MHVDEQRLADIVAAAQSGDQTALDELVAHYLPLVYNIVGRALDGHLDVDDVVQETMLRAVNGLDGLRDPESFRSWLVAIAMRQVRDRARVQRTAQTHAGHMLDEERDRADPGADFVDLTILRLHLDGQRQEVAEATRWLDEDDRHLLSLWWLEVAGELTRRELADALELTPQHAAVRVQRVKAQLEAARSVVRAINAVPRCYELATLTLEWDGRPSPLWRKRLARHTRGCAECHGVAPDQVPAERLLVGLALVPLPAGFALKMLSGMLVTGKAATAATTAVAATAAATGSAGGHGGGFGALVKAGFQLAMKPVVATTAGVTLVAGGAAVVYEATQNSAGGPLPRATASPSAPVAATTPLPTPAPATSAASPPTRVRPSPQSLYGSVVDVADAAPDPNRKPGTLPKRPVSTFTSSGGAKVVLAHNSDTVTLKGQGYFRIRWQIGTTGGRIGLLNPASWTGLRGKLFHVASGGGRRMDDGTDGQTGMGSKSTGYDTLPPGAQQMWQNEYYYLDGEVTLHNNESPSDYSLIVEPRTWDEINTDINTGPPQGVIRYGIVRDTGDDSAPVPQYVTRSDTADPRTVPQRSDVQE